MASDSVFMKSDVIKCTEILKENGFQVTVKVDLNLEVLFAETPGEDEISAQSTTKVTIDVLLEGKTLKVVTNAGAFIRNVEIFAAIYRRLKLFNDPRGGVLNARKYTSGFTKSLARHLLTSFNYYQRLRGRSRISGSVLNVKALDYLGDVAKDLAVHMNGLRMKVSGNKPSWTAEQCKQFCETKMTVTKMLPVTDPFKSACWVETEGAAPRGGQKVTRF